MNIVTRYQLKKILLCLFLLLMGSTQGTAQYFNLFFEQLIPNIQDTSIQKNHLLENVVIRSKPQDRSIKNNIFKTEVLSKSFFRKNASLNLTESLPLVNGVQEQINCGVCGTNEIRMNGMEGPYTLVLIDGMPIISALGTVYGLNGIPTELIERIEVTKGPTSSRFGAEAMGGSLNIITEIPLKAPLLSLNTYYSTHRESSTDLAVTFRPQGNIAGLLSGHYFRNRFRQDRNRDGFTDFALSERVVLFNKWTWQPGNRFKLNLAGRYVYEDRFGGQMHWQPQHRGSNQVYGESVYTNRGELTGTGVLYIGEGELRTDFSYTLHDQNSYYGTKAYLARQSIVFLNIFHTKKFHNHTLTAGVTWRYQSYDDNTPATVSADRRHIPGIFLEDELNLSEKWSLLLGARADYRRDHGIVPAPRLALQYKPEPETTLRLNGGRGFRLVNLFTEDHAALSGARTVVIKNKLKPEQSYNITLSLNKSIDCFGGNATADLDLYYYYFNNKIIPDYNTDPNLIIYDNLKGYALSRGLSAAWQQSFTFPLQLSLGINLQQVFQKVGGSGEKTPQLFVPFIASTFTASYTFKQIGLTLDWTGRITGSQNLPAYPEPFGRPLKSPWYSVQNLQVAKEFPHIGLRLYVGIKNIWNTTQQSPLIDPQNPFGEYFDTSYVWGPLQGRRFYLGLRYGLR